MHRIILSVLIVAAIGACRSDAPSERAPLPPLADFHSATLERGFTLVPDAADALLGQEPNTPAVVRLLTPGAEPRTNLRWSYVPTTFIAHVEYQEDFFKGDALLFGLTETATLRVVVTTTPAAIARATVLTHTRVTRGDVPANLPTDNEDIIGAQSSIALWATGDDFVLSPEGLTLRDSKPVRASLFTAVASLWAPLPADAIGVGARWTVDATSLRSQGRITKLETYLYELEAFDGQRGRLSAGMLSANHNSPSEQRFHRRLATHHDFDLSNPLETVLTVKGTANAVDAAVPGREKTLRSEVSARVHTTADTSAP